MSDSEKIYCRGVCTACTREEKFHETKFLPHISAKRGRVYGNVEISATTAYHVFIAHTLLLFSAVIVEGLLHVPSVVSPKLWKVVPRSHIANVRYIEGRFCK